MVLDVMMPGMDGFETLEEIRKENSLPILMFTSQNDSISKVRGLRAGADDYLTKPFDMDELIARIASLIRRYTVLIIKPELCKNWILTDCRLTLKIVLLRRKMALLNFHQRNLICSCTVQSIKVKF